MRRRLCALWKTGRGMDDQPAARRDDASPVGGSAPLLLRPERAICRITASSGGRACRRSEAALLAIEGRAACPTPPHRSIRRRSRTGALIAVADRGEEFGGVAIARRPDSGLYGRKVTIGT